MPSVFFCHPKWTNILVSFQSKQIDPTGWGLRHRPVRTPSIGDHDHTGFYFFFADDISFDSQMQNNTCMPYSSIIKRYVITTCGCVYRLGNINGNTPGRLGFKRPVKEETSVFL